MRILEEFWYGNIEPTEYDTSSCKEYQNSKTAFDRVCCSMVQKWGKQDFCREIVLE